MSIVTLIGSAYAKKGTKFVYLGETSLCKQCEYYNVCQSNLEKDRVYEVIDVKNVTHPCELHYNDVVLVEVQEAEIISVLPSKKAIEGAIVEFDPLVCDNHNCNFFNICNPVGLIKGDKVQVTKVLEKINCPLKKEAKLVKVKLKRVKSK